jgi:16S rRNA A1518/A1519 N6-dimethyltransferase RsmA/KsgA/DIM1 with predicted DNA glycosylase/AP lyase activity
MEELESKESIIERRKYRKNIKGDAFSLYISNYPVAVEYLKKRIGNKKKTVAELCCGIGITLEYIGDAFNSLVGVDIDKHVLSACADNLKNVNLLSKTTLIQGDINDDNILKKVKADVVIYDIPYWSSHKLLKKGNLTEKNPPLKTIIGKIRKFISNNIIILAPPAYNFKTVKNHIGCCEFQKVFIDGKYDRNHIYLGNLIEKEGIAQIKLFT